MAGRSTARRTETGRSHPARPTGRSRSEPVFQGARSGQPDPVVPPAVLTLALPAGRGDAFVPQAPAVVVGPEPAFDVPAPAIVVPSTAPESLGDAPLPVVETDLSTRGCPHPIAARVSLSVVASMVLHAGAAAAFVWLSLAPPLPISAGEEGIPVELVVAADTGSAAQQETASGRDATQTAATQSETRQHIEAPPAETVPESAAAEPVETPAEEPPVVQAEAPQPVAPPEALQRVDTQEPTEVQAAVAPQPVETPPPAPAIQPPPQATSSPPVRRVETPQPPVRREATRPPPARREAPTTRERRRPTHEVAATSRPERPARAARLVESRASVAERGEGTGQRNRHQSQATGNAGASSVAAVAAWRQRVLAHLARYKVYPESARERGIRGRTGIAFTLTGSGAVASVSIAASSGAPILDQATLAMVRRAQPFPPNPAGSSASFTAGVNYNLH